MNLPPARCARALLFCITLLPGLASAQDIASFEKRIAVKRLENGLTILVCERPESPVFSFYTHVDVGANQESLGQSGIAHMFEHMAFKGTERIGTKDYEAEKKVLAKVEEAYAAYRAERTAPRPDKAKLEALDKAWKGAMDEAQGYVVSNQFDEIVETNGGVGLNAYTNNDETGYFYSLPSNRLELWAYLESERFLRPVFREFYKERDVVMEERRMGESDPIGRLVEKFQSLAFEAHPYHHPTIGWMSDLEAFSASDAKAFFETYYVPGNLVVTVVGDVKAPEVVALCEKYFGRIPKKPMPPAITTVEPPQIGEKSISIEDVAQPFYIEGYHKPEATHPDDAVYAAISDIMSNGRVSRLYRSLVRDKKVAAWAAGFPGFPGRKYPNLFAFFGVPTPDHSNDEIRDAIRSEIARLKTEDVSDDELRMVKTRAKADLIRRLGTNEGLSRQLGRYQALYGDWRELFRNVERIEKVSKADIRRVASATFVDGNRTVGTIVTKKADAGAEKEAK